MKKLNLLFCAAVLCMLFSGCFNEEEGDREKVVEMTIYPETGYGTSVMSDIWIEPLLFSDSQNSSKRTLVDVLFEGLDNFDYERGYKYTLKAKKVWMENPPQDVASVKYVFMELLSKEKVITESIEKNIEVTVSDEKVKFMPGFPTEYEQVESEDGGNYEVPKVFDALYVKEIGTNNSDPVILKGIEGFDYEEGFEYTLILKKKVQAEPYAVEYLLLDIISKVEKE